MFRIDAMQAGNGTSRGFGYCLCRFHMPHLMWVLHVQCVPHALRNRKAGCCNTAEPRFDADGLDFLHGIVAIDET